MTTLTTTKPTANGRHPRSMSAEAELRLIELDRRGYSETAIARTLTAEGYRPPHGGASWQTSSISEARERLGLKRLPVRVPRRVIARMRQLQDNGLSLQKIADVLNAQNVPGPTGKGWHASTVKYQLDRAQRASQAA